jgi:hypothetical protein
MSRMPSRDQSHHQPYPSHTLCRMCSRSTTQYPLCSWSMASTDRRPSQPDQGHTHHSCGILQVHADQAHIKTARCRTVSPGPDRCRESQMDRSSTQETHSERSSPRCNPYTQCSHSHHRHTHQPHKGCMPSLQCPHSALQRTVCTPSTHHCPNQRSQLHTMCSSSTQQQSTDQHRTPHTL